MRLGLLVLAHGRILRIKVKALHCIVGSRPLAYTVEAKGKYHIQF